MKRTKALSALVFLMVCLACLAACGTPQAAGSSQPSLPPVSSVPPAVPASQPVSSVAQAASSQPVASASAPAAAAQVLDQSDFETFFGAVFANAGLQPLFSTGDIAALENAEYAKYLRLAATAAQWTGLQQGHAFEGDPDATPPVLAFLPQADVQAAAQAVLGTGLDIGRLQADAAGLDFSREGFVGLTEETLVASDRALLAIDFESFAQNEDVFSFYAYAKGDVSGPVSHNAFFFTFRHLPQNTAYPYQLVLVEAMVP